MPKKNKSMKKKTAAATTVDLSLSSSTTITSESESYIEMVRYLELDNCQLKQKVQSMEETFTREMSNMEAVYSLVLCNKRKLLDEADTERIELELDIKHLQNDNEDLKSKY
ncbi:lamin-C-like isoform X2 [Formica exsecta]|uniref:lamin-C-like isoform X2 n=1 Tax=Formica exsecta TaxID=72781 RepID=UPI0011429086|nr:lamin-C-like isoform X2 [Formica exsecta]